MAAIAWDEDLPSQSSAATLADDEFRSMLTAMATGLGESMYWPGSATTTGGHSGASIGELKPGSARMPVYTPAGGGSPPPIMLSRADMPDGFLGLETGENKFWHLGSSQGTYVLATADMLRAAAPGAVPYIARWVIQEGTISEVTVGDTKVTFGTAYNGIPSVAISRADTQALTMDFGITDLLPSGFSLTQLWTGSGDTQAATWRWRSEGTVNL